MKPVVIELNALGDLDHMEKVIGDCIVDYLASDPGYLEYSDVCQAESDYDRGYFNDNGSETYKDVWGRRYAEGEHEHK